MPIPQAPMDAGVKAPPVNQPVPPTGGIDPPASPNTNPIPNVPGLAPAAPQSAAPAGSPPPMTPPAPMQPVSATVPATAPASPAPGLSPAAPPTTTPLNGVGVQAIQPGTGSELRGSNILPTNQVDRQALAQSRFDTSAKASAPAYEAALRSATQHAAANGTIGSGMLNTDYGNLALQRERDLDTQRSTLNQNALEGSIGDAANNRSEYRQERGYQDALENQGYNRGVQGLTLEDALTNSAFGRAQGQNAAGQLNNPAPYELGLSELYGKNAGAAGSSLGEYMKGKSTNDAIRQGMTSQSPILNAVNGGGTQVGGSGAGDMNPGLGLPSIADAVGGYQKQRQQAQWPGDI